MKKISLLFVIIILIGCESNPINLKKATFIDCPGVLFAKEHRKYIASSSDNINIDNISHITSFNNAKFNQKCQIKDNMFVNQISLLFVSIPLGNSEDRIKIPYYIALLDKDNSLISIEYYSLRVNFNKKVETNELIETEIISKKSVKFSQSDNVTSLLVGFMLDEQQINLLN